MRNPEINGLVHGTLDGPHRPIAYAYAISTRIPLRGAHELDPEIYFTSQPAQPSPTVTRQVVSYGSVRSTLVW